jgi:hypothetical protein
MKKRIHLTPRRKDAKEESNEEGRKTGKDWRGGPSAASSCLPAFLIGLSVFLGVLASLREALLLFIRVIRGSSFLPLPLTGPES